MILKMQGEVTISSLATTLDITKEGARQKLVKLVKDDLAKVVAKREGVGRPVSYYSLTSKGVENFPDTHAQVTVDLLQSIRNLLGVNALDLLIRDREKKVYERYARVINRASTIEERLRLLSKIRSEEGYMAEWKQENDEYYLIENHCPICAAATECQGFCRAELANFERLIGSDFDVERVDHIVSGGQRCKYRIRAKSR